MTYALAKQLVLTLPGALSPDAMAELNGVWAQIQAFGARIEGVPLNQIHAELVKFEQAIRAIVEGEAGSTSGGSDSDGNTGSDGTEPRPGPTAGPTDGPGGDSTGEPGTGTEPSSEPTSGGTTAPDGTTSTTPTTGSTTSSASDSSPAPSTSGSA